jgi:Xaa-Pro aminopeptidase
LRAVKDGAELEALRAAARMSDEVLAWLAEGPLAGRTERELVAAVEARMRELGSDEPAFDTLVVSGPRAAEPHGDPADVPIEPDAVLIVDLGCVVDGYRSDCTRMFAPGGADGEAAEVYAAVARAQEAAVAALEPGAATRAVDGAARAVLTDAGYGEEFVHGVGHGVGLEIHEEPMLLRSSEGSVEEGNVVTIEPAVYLPGRFGVRLEDTVWLGPDGPERLTNFARELVVS